MSKEEQNVIKIPSKENFSLSKVKLLKGGGLDVHYEVTEVIGNEIYVNKYHIQSVKDIHPSLSHLFTVLRPIMAHVLNMTSFKTLIDDPNFEATKQQKEIAYRFADGLLDDIEVKGVTLSGKGENVGVVLSGLFEIFDCKDTAINTPRLKFNDDTFGFEGELENIVFCIENEVYAFLFEGKKAQLELFGADGETNEND